jgi:hypothetical protein
VRATFNMTSTVGCMITSRQTMVMATRSMTSVEYWMPR